MKDLKTVITSVRSALENQKAFYAGLKLDQLPQDIRQGIEDLKADLNQRLGALPPLDQVPAASEAAASLNWLVDCLVRMQEYSDKVFSSLKDMSTSLSTQTKNYNELKARVDAGDYVEKAKVTERCDLAKQAGIDSCAAEIADLRKKAISTLPVPPENILKLPTAEFATAIEHATANLETGKAKGLTLADKGKGSNFLKRAIWNKKESFATEMAELEADGLLGEKRDPLLGDEPPETAPAEGKRRLSLC